MLRSRKAPEALKKALTDVLLFSSEVVGSDGARQQLRHDCQAAPQRVKGPGSSAFSRIEQWGGLSELGGPMA